MAVGKNVIPVEGEVGEEEFRKIVNEKTLALNQRYTEEADERGTDYESPESEEDENDKWDAETILSTFTNTDNHPSIIKFVPKVKTNQKMKIELHK
jgi:protein LTV1